MGLRAPRRRRDPDAWMSSAYDKSLSVITRVGPHHADHAAPAAVVPEAWPTSSATLPALVVKMYQHAFLTDTSRLMVTCGSGYSTALACRRLGEARVTSVDVDPYLIQAAWDRLTTAGHRPQLEVCDVTGELPGVYDRIVSTVSVPAVPASWLTALAPGGRMVTALSGTGLLIVADKTADGGATGKVAPEPAAFMTTRHGDDYPPTPDNADLWATARKADGESVTTGRFPVMRVRRTWDVRSTLELTVPGIEHCMETAADGTRTAYMLHPDGSWARATAPGAPPGAHRPPGRPAPAVGRTGPHPHLARHRRRPAHLGGSGTRRPGRRLPLQPQRLVGHHQRPLVGQTPHGPTPRWPAAVRRPFASAAR
ncbi:hypothetical protein Sspor_81120 [Streptomyces spororaveus]|uniref:Protein-L-isoaspartate O-methyltransferase n=1 Tax=Streptomyces spororaveus TaxID=284039 RepID=A0ABQ3TQ72_9ACTN|nr:hypothetical protein Sspor_81120 [Streptomyces spororaveus]